MPGVTTAYQTGNHAGRPANGAGCILYSCTTHGLVYRDDGSTWTTYATLGTPGAVTASEFGAKGRILVGTGAGTFDDLPAGTDGHRLVADSGETTGVKWAAGTALEDEGEFTFLDATEAAAPSTPASGKVRIYAKSDGRIYSKDDAGTEYGPFDAAGGGAGGSDYIATISADTDLVQYWPLNEAAGSTSFADVLAGTALTGSSGIAAGGPPLQQDYGNGASVGIHATQINLSRSAITWPAAWTIEAWVFIVSLVSDTGLLGQWNGSGAMIYMADADSIRIYSGGTNAQWDAPSVTAVRGLHHIAMTHDGTTQKLIWDGDEKVSQTVGAPSSNAGGTFVAGGYSGGGSGGAPMFLISDIAIYDVAKSEADLLAHYELGMGI